MHETSTSVRYQGAEGMDECLARLPQERQEAFRALEKLLGANIDRGCRRAEKQHSVSWFVPHTEFPDGYHCDPKQPLPFADLSPHKQYITIHLFCLYVDPVAKEDFVAAWRATGKKLDMGAGCIRVRSLEQVPQQVLASTLRALTMKRHIDAYVASRPSKKSAKKASSAKEQQSRQASAATKRPRMHKSDGAATPCSSPSNRARPSRRR